MNTNTLSNYTQVAGEVVTSIKSLGPELFTVLICIILGYALKFIPLLVNKYIPLILVCVIGPGLYLCLSEPNLESFIDMRFPIIRQLGLGICCGFAAWAVHRAFLKGSWLDKKMFGNGEKSSTVIPDSGSDP